MSLIEPSNTMGPEPAAPPDPTHTYADTEAGGGGQSITPPQDVVVEEPTETEPDSFDRKYVEELRRENAKWRTRAHEYEETFSPLDESLRQGWLELISLANSGDPNAMDELAQMLGFEVQEQPQEEFTPDDTPQYLTAEQAYEVARQAAREEAEQRDAARYEQESVKQVADEAGKLGYEASSMEYVQLLYLANEIDPNSLPAGKSLLQAADEQLKARQQEAYDAFVAGKVNQANGSPVAPSGNGASPDIATQPWNSGMSENEKWAAVRESVHERLSNI